MCSYLNFLLSLIFSGLITRGIFRRLAVINWSLTSKMQEMKNANAVWNIAFASSWQFLLHNHIRVQLSCCNEQIKENTSARPLNLSLIVWDLEAWRDLFKMRRTDKAARQTWIHLRSQIGKIEPVSSSDGRQQRADAAALGPEEWRHRAAHTHEKMEKERAHWRKSPDV